MDGKRGTVRKLCLQGKKKQPAPSEGKRGGGHEVNMESAWAQEDVPAGSALQSGPSATTGQLLRLLHEFKNQVNLIQVYYLEQHQREY